MAPAAQDALRGDLRDGGDGAPPHTRQAPPLARRRRPAAAPAPPPRRPRLACPHGRPAGGRGEGGPGRSAVAGKVREDPGAPVHHGGGGEDLHERRRALVRAPSPAQHSRMWARGGGRVRELGNKRLLIVIRHPLCRNPAQAAANGAGRGGASAAAAAAAKDARRPAAASPTEVWSRHRCVSAAQHSAHASLLQAAEAGGAAPRVPSPASAAAAAAGAGRGGSRAARRPRPRRPGAGGAQVARRPVHEDQGEAVPLLPPGV